MPLIARFSWTETATGLEVHIPLKGTSPKKVDVFATDCILKVSFPPYLVDIDLRGRIDDDNSKAFVRDGVLIIKARKHEESLGTWGEISAEKGEATRVRRQDSIAGKTKREQELRERVKVRKHEDERKALRQQMSVEEAERRRIEDLKADEKRRAEEDVYRTFAELESKRRPAAAQQNMAPTSATSAAAAAAAAESVPAEPAGYDSADAVCASEEVGAPPGAESGGNINSSESGVVAKLTRGIMGGTDASCAITESQDGSRAIWGQEDGSAEHGGNDESEDGRRSSNSSSSGDGGSDTEKEESTIGNDAIPDGAGAPTGSPGAVTDDQSTGSSGSSGDGSWVDVKSPAAAVAIGGAGGDTSGDVRGGSGAAGRSQAVAAVTADVEVRYMPAPREARQVALGFTPRVFPTPLRESRAAEEEAWVIRNRSHLRRSQVPGVGQLAVAEGDPAWLKAKGDDFYRAGDLQSAVSAYTAALDTAAELSGESASATAAASSAMVTAAADAATAATETACLSNRAACHLRLGDLDRCIADCTAALVSLRAGSSEIHSAGNGGGPSAFAEDSSLAVPTQAVAAAAVVLPAVKAAAAASITKLLARRGAALARLGDYSHSAADIARAANLAPQDTALAADREIVDRLACCAALKQRADKAVAAAGSSCSDSSTDNGLEAACELYTEALRLVPTFVSCLSNRAACYLAMGQLESCEADCSRALDLLQKDDSTRGNDSEGASANGKETAPAHGNLLRDKSICDLAVGPVPPPGSEKQRQWMLRTLARRGAARLRLGELGGALRDMEAAAALAPKDYKLRADADKLKEMMAATASAATVTNSPETE